MSNPSPPPETSMHAFGYEAQTPQGVPLRGTLDATTAVAATAQLNALNLRVLNVEPEPRSGGVRHRPLGPDDFLIFNRQLAHMTAAGMPVERGLRLIAADMVSGKLAAAAQDVAADLEKGTPLQQAFARQSSRFPALYGRLVDAGVQAGNLSGILFNLGHHLDLVARLRRSLWRTLAYPCMVLVFMSLVLLFISLVVLPQFQDMYRDFRTTLPLLTTFIFTVGDAYPYLLLGVAILIAAGLAYIGMLRATGRSGVLADHFLMRVPVIGPVLKASLLARWVDALRLAIEAGLDLPRAIALASDATASQRIAVEGRALADAISSGESPVLFTGRIIPATVPAAIELSARAGDLPATLATLSRMYQQQAEHRIGLAPMILTPLALIVIAGMVVIAICAMFLPLVKLVQSVSGGEG